MVLLAMELCASSGAAPPLKVMPLGDSITQGGQGYPSWRYPLWFLLRGAGLAVDFVGTLTIVADGNVNTGLFPDYDSTFDRDHEGHWGWRTDQVLGIIDGAAASTQPDVALIHLGTNDVGLSGAAGVTAATANLQQIIARLRAANPQIAVLIAQIIPPGRNAGTYTLNVPSFTALNANIAQFAAALDTAQSRVLVVDQATGFVPGTDLYDSLHPNESGMARMAQKWFAALRPIALGQLASIPRIAQPPASLDRLEGMTATLTVTATGAATLTYQWHRGDAPIPGATAPTLAVGPLTASDAGIYRVVVANASGTVSSIPAALTVVPRTTLTSAWLPPMGGGDAAVQIGLLVRADWSYQLFSSPDLVTWSSLDTVSGQTGGQVWQIPVAPGASKRFYRVEISAP